MPNLSDLGRALLLIGAVIVALGVVLLVLGRAPFLGRLPGDLALRRGGTSLYVPIVTCLMLSAALTVLVNLILYVLRRR